MSTRAERRSRWRRDEVRRVLVAVLVACAASITSFRADPQATPPASVDIQDSRFLPPTLTVSAGTTVRWVNRDEETHTVTSATGIFGSAGLELGEEYAHTFTSPGVYQYTCDLHSFMHGTIVVE